MKANPDQKFSVRVAVNTLLANRFKVKSTAATWITTKITKIKHLNGA